MNKKTIIIGVMAVIALVVIVAIIVIMSSKGENQEISKTTEDGVTINTSEKLAETKTYNGLEFTNIKFSASSSITNLSADVKNTTSDDMPEQMVGINVLDKDGNVLTTFRSSIEEIKAGETKTISAAITGNYANAYDLEIVEAY